MAAIGCCVVLLVAWLFYVLTASRAIPKALMCLKQRLHSLRRFIGSFLGPIILGKGKERE